jgi:putative CocE/NonD family hydrolase
MKKVKVLIIDDERPARDEIKRALIPYHVYEVAGEAADAADAREQILSKVPDLIFLDIQMPGGSGFDLLASLDYVPDVIFTTAYDQYALQAFEAGALDYLLKPVREERFARVMERDSRRRAANEGDRQLFIKDGERCYFVKMRDLYFIESLDNYARLYFLEEKALLKTSLTQLQAKLDTGRFFRINRTQIVNADHVEEVIASPGGRLTLQLKGKLLEVSERQSVKFKSWYKLLLVLGLSLLHCLTKAQSLYFPHGAAKDSMLLSQAMPLLAAQVLQRLEKDSGDFSRGNDPGFFGVNVFMCQMVAGHYAAADSTIDAYRAYSLVNDPAYTATAMMEYQTFIQARLQQDGFDSAFARSFRTICGRLTEAEKQDLETRFSIDVLGLHQVFSRLLPEQDSLSLRDAIFLCRSYNDWQTHCRMDHLVPGLLAEENSRYYSIQDSLLVQTRDGALVPVIVVRKKGNNARLPVIFYFTIYAGPKNFAVAKRAAAAGYAGVVANTRGKRGSPDPVVPYEHDGKDAYDVIDWISRQSWCNGRVGMYGGSYVGFTQWAAARQLHPALKTIVPSVSVAPGLDVPMENNVFLSFVYPWIPYVTNNKLLDDATYDDWQRWSRMYSEWFRSGAAYRSLESIDGQPNVIFRRWLDHPDYDAYWQSMIPYKKEFSRINIPVLSTTGYFDGGQIGALYYFREHHRWLPGAAHYLLIGPWDHWGAQSKPSPEVSGYRIDPVANISITDIIYQWFDHVLRGGPLPALLKDTVTYQVMGTNEWRHAASLEKMHNGALKFYLSSGGKLRRQQGGISFIGQTVDLADRQGPVTYNAIHRSLASRELNTTNGLVFISDPLKMSLVMDGCFSGQLRATINRRDMDIGVDLYELRPDSSYFQLSYFLGRASYAHDRSHRQLLTPGRAAVIPFSNTRMICKKLEKGSRIVVVLNISKSPYEQINYGTGHDVSDETIADAKEPLKIKWSADSWISIPVTQ